jgi:GAF domain-containing protein
MQHSVDWAIELLGHAESLDEIVAILRGSARVGAHADGVTVVLREGDGCHYVEEDAVGPLWKGQSFPLRDCISGWAMLHEETVVVPDIRRDDRIPQQAYRPTFVRSLAMVPIGSKPVGAIGAYWRTGHVASSAELGSLQRLAAAAGSALSRLGARPLGLRLGDQPQPLLVGPVAGHGVLAGTDTG